MNKFLQHAVVPMILIAVSVIGAEFVFAQTGEAVLRTETTTSPVEVDLRLVRMLSDKWEFELSARNSADRAVYILTDPMRSNGSKGSYFALDPHDPSTLWFHIQFYPLPEYCIFSNQTHVTLKRLEPGALHVELITVSFPAKETSPPYKGYGFETLDRSRIRTVRAALGFLPNDEGLQDFLRRKEGIGPYARGSELIHKGSFKEKSLLELQEIVRTPILKLPLSSSD